VTKHGCPRAPEEAPQGASADRNPDVVAPGVFEPQFRTGMVSGYSGDFQPVSQRPDVVPGRNLDEHLAETERVLARAGTRLFHTFMAMWWW
jgi:hypothetical protein